MRKLSANYTHPLEALEDFFSFAGHARCVAEANPQWREWLESSDISNPDVVRHKGKWQRDWEGFVGKGDGSIEQRLSALRKIRQREYLRLGLFDFSGFASLEETIEDLSSLAEFCLQRVLEIYQKDFAVRYGEVSSPFGILGMGKLGGGELNYSSDIDLIFIYGEEGALRSNFTFHEYFVRLGEKIVRAVSETTQDGRMYRVDMRLRPDGDAGALAVSMESCENYYASMGETWERMAMIKARMVAGDGELGYEFEHMRTAFCYASNIDNEVLGEIGHLKRRIEREVVGLENLDRDVKRGEGGIREIEFIAQALQILHGSKLPYVRQIKTLKAMNALETLKLLPKVEVSQLEDAYVFLRCVEHRLQMVADLQTHELPSKEKEREKIARSLGLSHQEFEETLKEHRNAVRSVFEKIFPETHKETPVQFNLDYFSDPKDAERHAQSLLKAASGNISKRVRQSFQRLQGGLEKYLREESCDADATLVRFVRFVEGYGGRAYLYESLANNPKALVLLLKLFDMSRFHSDLLLSRPGLFEEVARGGGLDLTKNKEDYLKELQAVSGDAAVVVRKYRNEELLRIFLRDILSLAKLPIINAEYSALAVACLEFALLNCKEEGDLCVIGMGKLGGGEISYGSDLDCLLVGEGEKKAKELMSFMAENRAEGGLFPVDLRLRPNGEGALTLSVQDYVDYYRTSAQFWEIQALTRAQPVAGNEELGGKFMEETEVVWKERSKKKNVMEEIARVKEKIEEHRVSAVFPEGELKTGKGGLVDIEFSVQGWLMKNGLRVSNTLHGIEKMREEYPEVATDFQEGYLFLRRVESVLRCENNDSVSVLPQKEREQRRLAKKIGFMSWDGFFKRHCRVMKKVREGFEKITQGVTSE